MSPKDPPAPQTYRPAVLAHNVLTAAVVVGAVVVALLLLVTPST